MKQTPIEFLIERIAENGILHSSDVHEANEIFKEQIKCSFIDGASWELYGENITHLERSEQYYNQTYKK
jgi:hypothetical protein